MLPPSVGPSAALVTIDARTGQVLAMVGRPELQPEPVQPRDRGRASAGLGVQGLRARCRAAQGISPATTLVSAPVTIYAGGRLWYVNNFEHESLGPIDLATAIAYSDNTVFAQLTNIVGPASVVKRGAARWDHNAR